MDAVMSSRHQVGFPTQWRGAQGLGILYIEDFDAHDDIAVPEPEQAPPEPSFTLADVDAARASGRVEGLETARGETERLHAELRLACLQSITDAALATRSDAERIVEHQGSLVCSAILAVLNAALPATTAHHAKHELEAIFAAVLPGLRCEPELRIRVHPDLEEFCHSALAEALTNTPTAFLMRPDPSLSPGDVSVEWNDGRASRSNQAIWDAIALALLPLKLPSFEEIARGR